MQNVLTAVVILSSLFTAFVPQNSMAQAPMAYALSDNTSYYEMGMEKYKQGQWRVAMRVWYQGIKTSVAEGKVDPRLGFALIRAATEHHAKNYFSIAQQAYYWSLNKQTFHRYRDIYEEELRRVIPLMDSNLQKKIRKKLQDKDSTVLADLRAFWEQKDPVLNTDLNERLMEHWQRIATARKKYQKAITTVYGTDDRGKIFIKYGAPERIHEGTLTFDQALFRTKASELIDLLNPSTVQTLDSTSSSLATSLGPSFNKDAQLLNLTNKAREYFRNPGYEIWIYKPAPGEVQNTIFIFGQNANSSRWELLKSVEDLLPNSAFGLRGDQSRTMGTPISSGLIIQVMTYHQLSHLDHYFLTASLDLESKIFSSLHNNSLYMDVAARNKNEFDLYRLQAQMPSDYSSLEQQTPNIVLDYRSYRLIDKNNKPKLLLAVKSNPHQALLYAWARKPREKPSMNLDLIHAAKVVNGGSETPVIQSDTAEIYFSERSDLSGEILATNSLFLLEHDREALHTLSAELLKREAVIADSSVLSGLGKITVDQPAPLSTDAAILEMSDLILGYGRSEDSSRFLPFVLSLDHRIPQGENISVHFEVYHLFPEDGSADFRIHYEIYPLKKGLAKIFGGGKKQQVALTLNLTSTDSRFFENLEIATNHLKPGTYELQLTASDPVRNRTKKRSITFEIVD